jgi:hypothetical protein
VVSITATKFSGALWFIQSKQTTERQKIKNGYEHSRHKISVRCKHSQALSCGRGCAQNPQKPPLQLLIVIASAAKQSQGQNKCLLQPGLSLMAEAFMKNYDSFYMRLLRFARNDSD